jgi:UTP--glucose-1-phosphate uridylyltransferase
MGNMIRTTIIPAAGLGTRLLPATKQQPKEMLPVFVRDSKGLVLLKPLIQLVFERLYDSGLREFLFVVGKGKRSIEDHFTPDNGFTEQLRRLAKPRLAYEMEQFYRRVRSSNIVFINQPEPLGFGDAVLRAKPFTCQKPFIVHAGDDLIISRDAAYFRRLAEAFSVHEADAAFCVQKVMDPTKYGVIEGDRIGHGIYRVRHVEEKPRRPKSRVAIVALYAFNERIYHYLERVRKCHDHELELTDAIEGLVEDGGKVYAVELNPNETRIDIGSPESYWNALRATMT